MASFTDQIPQFNPYIEQLPIDAMVKVGMEKQRRYDEGVQKIQASVENVAGLSVLKDIDKVYLQSTLNQLGSNLKMVAAGDFSNYQLVNSVSGMANQIIKDPNIQNAVQSTANHKKQLAIMEEAKAKGELAPENIDAYNKQFNAYYNSNQAGELFTGQYTPYINVTKKLFDIGKEVGLDETTTQQLFETDAQGNVIYEKDAKGNNIAPKFNPIMVEKHLKGKDVGKILSTFKAALTPADYNQLAITGRYVNAGLSEKELAESINTKYSKDLLKTNAKLQEIKIELDKENSKNIKDEKKIESLRKQKEFFESHDADLKKAMGQDMELVTTNPDAVRASLYTNNYLTSIATGIGGITEETKYSVNPMFTINMEEQKWKRQLERDAIADARYATERADKQLELFLKYGIGTPPPGYKGPGSGTNEPIQVEGNQLAIVGAVHDDYSAGVAELNNTNYALTVEYFKRANPIRANEDATAYENRIKKAIYDVATAKKESVDPESGSINTFTARFANKQLMDWKKDPNSVPLEMRGLMEQQNQLTRSLSVQKENINNTKKEAAKIAEQQGINPVDYEEVLKNAQPTTVNLPNGVSVKLSKSDVVDFANLHPEKFNLFGSLTVDKEQEQLREQSRKRLQLKYGNALNQIEKTLYGTTATTTDQILGIGNLRKVIPSLNLVSQAADYILSGGQTVGVNSNVSQVGRKLSDSKYAQTAKIEAQLYLDKGYIKQPKAFPLLKGKENTQDFNSRIANITSKYNLDPTTVDEVTKAILAGDSKLVKIIANPGVSSREPISYSMRVTTKNGVQELTIAADDFSYLTGQPPLSNNPVPLVVSQLNNYGTTGHEGSDAPDAAWFTASDFKNVRGTNYTVTGNLVADKANPNNLWFRMFVHTKDGKVIPLTYTEPIPKFNPDGSLNQDLDRIPEGIFPTTIEQLMRIK